MRCSSSWSFQPRLSAIVISPEDSTRDLIKLLYVVEVFGPATALLEGPQVIEPHDVHRRAVVQDRVEPARPCLLEVERLFDEEVEMLVLLRMNRAFMEFMRGGSTIRWTPTPLENKISNGQQIFSTEIFTKKCSLFRCMW